MGRTPRKIGNVIEVLYPMYVHTEDLPNVSDYVALMYGPIVLSAKTGTANLNGLVADDGRWSHIASGALESLDQAPMLASKKEDIPSKLEPVKGEPLHFKAPYLFANKKDGRGANATDPEPIDPTGIANAVRYDVQAEQVYRVYGLNGNFVGSVFATSASEAQSKVRAMVSEKGVYLIRAKNGMVHRFTVTK